MRILVTNDDGYNSEGIKVLYEVAREFGEVTVVAPKFEQSGVSHAITLLKPLWLKEISPEWYCLEGTPVDCVFLALGHIMTDRRPDLVLSGINSGPNLGWDVVYSGTVAAAIEGALKGVPSIAFSTACGKSDPHKAAPFVKTVIKHLLPLLKGHPIPVNVNIPMNGVKGYKVAKLGRRVYSNEVIERVDPRGRDYLWIGGERITMDDDPETDCGLITKGYVTITPLKPLMPATGDLNYFKENLSGLEVINDGFK